MKTLREAIDLARRTRWAGTKDEFKSVKNAEAWLTPGYRDGPTVLDWKSCPVDTVTHTGILQVVEYWRARGLANSTINRRIAALGVVLRVAHEHGWKAMTMPSGLYLRETPGRTRVVTENELGALCAEVPPAYSGLLVFLYETGCRVGEALKLNPLDIELRRRLATFRDTKNGMDRSVPMTTRALHVLRTGPHGLFQHLSQASLNREWARARTAMGLETDPGFVPHALRHTAISRWVAAGVPLAVVQKLAGHKSIQTTLRYTHLSTEDVVDALKKAGQL